jgi:hypothetical protein
MTQSYQETLSFTHSVHRRDIDPEQAANLKAFRLYAMHLLKVLKQIMPANAKKAVPEDGHVKPLPLEYDRLLGPKQGVIDGLAKLTHLIMAIIDKERETNDHTQSSLLFNEGDEDELERRILAELDRVAAQRGSAESDPESVQIAQA